MYKASDFDEFEKIGRAAGRMPTDYSPVDDMNIRDLFAALVVAGLVASGRQRLIAISANPQLCEATHASRPGVDGSMDAATDYAYCMADALMKRRRKEAEAIARTMKSVEGDTGEEEPTA